MYKPSFRKKKNGVPILSKDEIDAIGERFILEFCPEALNEPMEIDIDGFLLNYLGLKQDFQYLSNNGIYLGMTVFNDTHKVPVYNPESNTAEYISAQARTVIIDNNLLDESQEHRYRYTMGHEGGHDIFHGAYFSYDPNQLCLFDQSFTPLIQCREASFRDKPKPVTQWNDRDSMEWQANYLSSAILMPKSSVLKLAQKIVDKSCEYWEASCIWETAKIFNVSDQAAQYRLEHFGIIRKNFQMPDLLTLDF